MLITMFLSSDNKKYAVPYTKKFIKLWCEILQDAIICLNFD